MKCDICGKEKAVLHIQEIIGNERHQINICKECEINGNIMEKCLELEFDNIDTAFPNYRSLPSKKKKKKVPNSNKVCKVCGYSLEDFLKTGAVCCPKCYEYLKSDLSKAVKKIHRENKHIGKICFDIRINKFYKSQIRRLDKPVFFDNSYFHRLIYRGRISQALHCSR